jgi:hypothetical protein
MIGSGSLFSIVGETKGICGVRSLEGVVDCILGPIGGCKFDVTGLVAVLGAYVRIGRVAVLASVGVGVEAQRVVVGTVDAVGIFPSVRGARALVQVATVAGKMVLGAAVCGCS